MTVDTPGLHHVTAIAGDAQRNLEFYAGTLGLRPVKRTVNFDDPYTYHLYYGDEVGRPGTAMTFFPVGSGRSGVPGAAQARTTSFLVPRDSLDAWHDRLRDHDVAVEVGSRFDDPVLSFTDPDGLPLELVGREAATAVEPWAGGPVDAEQAVRGFEGVTLALGDRGETADLLGFMGLERTAEADGRIRFRAEAALGGVIDLIEAERGVQGVGTVHHIAFRAPDETTQTAWREALIDRGLHVTGVKDRWYFRSVYFREPGGVLFEIATDGPGFTRDESDDALGTSLSLPDWLEGDRDVIEGQLPPLGGLGADTVSP